MTWPRLKRKRKKSPCYYSSNTPWPGGKARVTMPLFVVLLHCLLAFIVQCVALSDDIRFTSTSYNASVLENSLDDTPIISEEMMGIFLPSENMRIRYRIAAGDPDNLFKVNSKVVGNFCFLELHVRKLSSRSLNRERKDMYSLQIKAQRRLDNRTRLNIQGAETMVMINIGDLNDLSPLFSQPVYSVEVSEDTPIYSSIIKVHADDPDLGLNGNIYYNFKEESSIFCIHPHLGIVTSTGTLNFHEKSVYNLTLVARDRGPDVIGQWPAQAKLIITVLEVNVFEPQMKVSLLEEMSPKGHLLMIAIVTVLDNDEGVSGLVDSLEIVDGDPERVFRIVPSEESNEFSLAALRTVDWVSRPSGYNLTLKATDRGTIARFSYKDIYVAPPASAQQKPFLQKSHYKFNISEASPPGSFIGNLCHWIPGSRSDDVYFLSEETKVREFAVEPTCGTLTTLLPLDAETIVSYSFRVLAKSKDLSVVEMADIEIQVIDANDNTPMIVAPQGVVQMNENQPANTWVVKVRAQDYDFSKNGDVSYSLSNSGNVPFKIDHFTGEVRTTKVLDYESGRRIWKLLVRASDWGEPFRRQTEKVITIHVQDVNDNHPQFERVDCSGYIDRSAPLGTEIFTLSAIDFDVGNIISYRILSGNDDRCFDLDSSKGTITLMCDLLDMNGNERFLNVTATDGQNFADSMNLRLQLIHSRSTTSSTPWADLKCSETFVTKTLASLMAESSKNNEPQKYVSKAAPVPLFSTNHHAPTLNNPPKEMRVPENSEIGTIILTLEANDVDSGYDGYLAFAISDGNHQSVFRIDVSSGNLIIAGELDREQTDKYTLNMTACDLGAPQKCSSHQLSVIIVDENDNAPKFDKVAYSFFLPESVANGTNVHQLQAVDPDSGRFGIITYSLITDTKDFWMNPSTGLLSVSGSLDYETIEEYELRVVATDGGGLSTQAYIMIQVADVNDCAPQFFNTKDLTEKVAEDAPLGSLVALVYAYDSDSSNLKYFIEEGSTSFSIDENSGAVRVAELLDYEAHPIHNISIRATDDGLRPLSTVTTVTIEVLDVNENMHAPMFGRNVVEVAVPESLPPHSLVLSVPAVDKDLNLLDAKVTYSITGTQGRGLFYIDQQGDIYTSSWLDGETQSHYWLTIQARDSGTSPLHSTLHVYIQVLDVNDNVPRPESPAYTASIEEGSQGSIFVVKVSAVDKDPDTSLSYSIGAGNEKGLFLIDSQSGTALNSISQAVSIHNTLSTTASRSDRVESRGQQTFFTVGRITERMTSAGRIIILFNTCKPERKLWEKAELPRAEEATFQRRRAW
ncbi:Cadherin [Trinorchestia longiramus]|nr:Cadherin [Trinorchestia longiramus]